MSGEIRRIEFTFGISEPSANDRYPYTYDEIAEQLAQVADKALRNLVAANPQLRVWFP